MSAAVKGVVLLALAAVASAIPTDLVSKRASTPASNLCGDPNAYTIVPGTPWIVFSMNYNVQYLDSPNEICTGFEGLVTGSDGQQKVAWNSTWNIPDNGNAGIVKGYSFVGLTENLENTIDDIESIPSTYFWTRSNETKYEGNVVYDFMTSDTKGDSTSTSAHELMLWLRYEGGQVPIGYSSGPVATITLYGKTWTLYQGVNDSTGITVSSLLVDPDDQYFGWFSGDIKEWLVAMANQGLFTTSTYVNVGNAGMEPFYGTVHFNSRLGLQVNLA